jgi:predicted glycosyltransferase
MRKGLFYCQPFVGVGHLKRSLYLCQELVKSFEIDFLYGGPEKGLFFDHPHFHLHHLPPLLYEDLAAPDAIFAEREKALIPFKSQFYDFAITEMYPFSKQNMGREIDPLLAALKTTNAHCQIYCSLKGIMLPMKREEWIFAKIGNFYDAILNHSDPAAMAMEEFIQTTPEILQKTVYTGFVTDPTPLNFSLPRQKRIVVSMGAGAYGEELLLAALKVPPLFSNYEFLFSLGPKASPEILSAAKNTTYPNVKVVEFINDFTTLLSQSALSINLGGSTLVDTMQARIPSLVYPESYEEHLLRTMKFAARGGIFPIRKQDLFPTRLAALIQTALQKPYQVVPFLLNGSPFTHAYLLNQWGEKPFTDS